VIHPTAIVSPEAEVADGVIIGPYAVVDGPARLAAGCVVEAAAQLVGRVEVGPGTRVGRGSVIGGDPQDLGFDPSVGSGVKIGAGNTIREHVTIHRSSRAGGATTVGDRNYLMSACHLGHDSSVGSHCVIANAALVAGHVAVGDHVFVGGGAVFHQFIRIGDYAMVQGLGAFSKDIPPFCSGLRVNHLAGLNVVGLRRHGFSAEQRSELKRLFDLLFRSGLNLSQALAAAADPASGTWSATARRLLDFVANPSPKGVCTRARGE
jgi:UDP-N-acetylglucosamine acyltransferase